MLEHIITILSSVDFLSSVSNNIDVLASVLNRYLSGANNLRLASIILMLLAFILFLFLIIVLYVKSIVSFLKSDQAVSARKTTNPVFEDLDDDVARELTNELELEKELEKELERELEQSRAEKLYTEQQEQSARERQALERAEQEEKEKKEREEKDKKQKEEEQTAETERSREKFREKNVIDLDWSKNKIAQDALDRIDTQTMNLQYHQSRKTLPDLMGLIIDMIGRGVDDLKIAQTIMYRNQGTCSEDDVLQVIDATKEFIALCINDKFRNLSAQQPLPKEDAALFHLAKGDPSLALALIEALMDKDIDRSTNMALGAKRDAIFTETSNNACTFGTLASLTDIHLATGAFELSIELLPHNVNAWSRVADSYAKAESNNKAMWAYQNVINLADEDVYPRQVANANKMLSQYYYEQGNSLQAAKLYNASKQYYDSIGINRRLDKKEVEIVEIIESRQSEDLETTIAKILARSNSRSA